MSLSAVVLGAISASACGAAISTPIYVAPTGSDSNRGTAAAPLLSFGRAYQLARPGQTVIVQAGDYPYQRIAADPAKRTPERIVFKPAPGATVNVAMVDFGQEQEGIKGPARVTIRDMKVGYIRAWRGTSDVVWRNITGRSFGVIAADNLRVLGGSFGPCLAGRDSGCTPLLLGTNLLVDGASFHDQTLDPKTSAHVDGMFIRGCQNCTVRNSKFWGNYITNVRVQDCCGNSQTQNLTLENNFLAAPLTGTPGGATRFDAIDVDTPVPNLRLISNSMVGAGIGFLNAPATAPAQVIGNIFGRMGCDPNAVYSHNVYVPFSQFTGQKACSPTERRLSNFEAIGFANPASTDLHLTARSKALRFVAANSCVARSDIDGQRRWPGRRCDAGADQRSQTICRRIGKAKRFVTSEVDPERLALLRRRGAKLGPCPKRR